MQNRWWNVFGTIALVLAAGVVAQFVLGKAMRVTDEQINNITTGGSLTFKGASLEITSCRYRKPHANLYIELIAADRSRLEITLVNALVKSSASAPRSDAYWFYEQGVFSKSTAMTCERTNSYIDVGIVKGRFSISCDNRFGSEKALLGGTVSFAKCSCDTPEVKC